MLAGGLVGAEVVLAVLAVRAREPVSQLLLIAGIALQGAMPAIMSR